MLVKLTRSLVFALAVFVTSTVAQAGAPTAADRATARQLMLEGRTLRHDKNLKGALEKFAAADALMRVPTTGLELARTQADLGLFVEALDTCARVIRHSATPGEPEPFREARAEAKKLRGELRKRTPFLRFVFSTTEGANGVELRVDGVVIPKEAFQTPRLVNPGKHEVTLTAGAHHQLIPVVVEEGETREVTLTLPTQEPSTKQPLPPEEAAANPWVWGGFTTAAVGGAIGTVAGVLAWSERNKLDDACPDRTCTADEMDGVDRAYRYANVSSYAFILGGIGAAVGVGALLSSGSDKRDDVSVRAVRCTSGTFCVNGIF